MVDIWEIGWRHAVCHVGQLFLLPKHLFRCLIPKKSPTNCAADTCCGVKSTPPPLCNGRPPLLLPLIAALFKHIEGLRLGPEGRGSSVTAFPDINEQSRRLLSWRLFAEGRFARLADLGSHEPIGWTGCLWC